MPTITEGQLTFEFPDDWEASQFDKWGFYRHQFNKLSGVRVVCGRKGCGQDLQCVRCRATGHTGVKAVDIVALDGKSCCWFIEIKDYRQHRRTKAIDLADEICVKVRDSLACLAAAAVNANAAREKSLARTMLKCGRFRVVLHLEQPAKHSKLFPRAIDRAKVTQRLKQLIKAIDPHPLVREMEDMRDVGWKVSEHDKQNDQDEET